MCKNGGIQIKNKEKFWVETNIKKKLDLHSRNNVTEVVWRGKLQSWKLTFLILHIAERKEPPRSFGYLATSEPWGQVHSWPPARSLSLQEFHGWNFSNEKLSSNKWPGIIKIIELVWGGDFWNQFFLLRVFIPSFKKQYCNIKLCNWLLKKRIKCCSIFSTK